jgi:hypothetical protein
MKGIIFDLLEEVVTGEYGDETWEQLLASTGLDGAYTAVGSYPDDEMFALIRAATSALSIDADALLRWFGIRCMPLLADRYPAFFTPHTTTRAFLLTLNEVIHPEVRKLFPGAYAPSFDFAFPTEDTVELGYFSHRKMCSFAEGLIEGAAEHYAESVSIDQRECAKRGDERCVLVATFKTA